MKRINAETKTFIMDPFLPPDILKVIADREKQQLLSQLCAQIPEEFIKTDLYAEGNKLVLELKIDLAIKPIDEEEEDGSKS